MSTQRFRRDYQAACPACGSRIGNPCKGKQGETLPGVHFQRTRALRAQIGLALRALYAPLPQLQVGRNHAIKGAIFLACLFGSISWSQTLTSTPWKPDPAQQTEAPKVEQPIYANHSIMLVNPAGGAVVLMHSPKNQLEFVDVTRTNDALAAGYVPLRTAEISELITGLNEEVIRLRAENERLRQVQARVDMQPSYRSQAVAPTVDLAAQAAAERAQRRQQLLQAWIMLQNMNRSQTINLNVTDCTRAPCAR